MNAPLIGATVVTAQVTQVSQVQGFVNADGVYEVQGTQDVLSNSLLPYPDEGKWHHELFERCCSCGSDCWLAWCCPCVTVAQIVSKANALGIPYCMSFNVSL